MQVSGVGTLRWGDYIGNNMFMSLGEAPVLRCSTARLWRTTIIVRSCIGKYGLC